VAHRGSSKYPAFGIALTRHLHAGDGPSPGSGSVPSYQAHRVGLFSLPRW